VTLASAARLDGGYELMPHFSFESYAAEMGRAPDLIVVPFLPGFEKNQEPGMAEWIRAQAEAGAFVTSICVGAEALAATGLLDGGPATTHPSYLAGLERSRPQVEWRRDVRYVERERVITSGAIASGMDAMLATVRRLLGNAKALEVAASLGYAHTQFLEDPAYPTRIIGIGSIARSAYRFSTVDLAVVLYDGVEEAALGSVSDAYSTTGDYEIVGVGVEKELVVSKHGLWLMPRASLAERPGIDRILIPGRSIPADVSARVDAYALNREIPVTKVHQGTNGFAYDAALADIAARDSQVVAEGAAQILNYPISHLTLPGARFPKQLFLGISSYVGIGLLLTRFVQRRIDWDPNLRVRTASAGARSGLPSPDAASFHPGGGRPERAAHVCTPFRSNAGQRRVRRHAAQHPVRLHGRPRGACRWRVRRSPRGAGAHCEHRSAGARGDALSQRVRGELDLRAEPRHHPHREAQPSPRCAGAQCRVRLRWLADHLSQAASAGRLSDRDHRQVAPPDRTHRLRSLGGSHRLWRPGQLLQS
jgi:hypothetical protein